MRDSLSFGVFYLNSTSLDIIIPVLSAPCILFSGASHLAWDTQCTCLLVANIIPRQYSWK